MLALRLSSLAAAAAGPVLQQGWQTSSPVLTGPGSALCFHACCVHSQAEKVTPKSAPNVQSYVILHFCFIPKICRECPRMADGAKIQDRLLCSMEWPLPAAVDRGLGCLLSSLAPSQGLPGLHLETRQKTGLAEHLNEKMQMQGENF